MAAGAVRYALFALGFAPLAYYLVSIFAAGRFFGRRGDLPAESPSFTPPVSIVKPIYGLDRETYENYASFCAQDYPEYEILFCVSDEADPAVAVIHKIIQDFPDRAIRLLIGSEPLGVSDKVNKLCRMAREAKHETLIVSDSDVRVDVDYLREVVAPFQDARVGGVTCLYRGLTDNSLAADLEAIGNSTDFAAGVLVAWLFSEVNFMLGATMAVRKTVLAEIGGFESMVDYFSDDYELGNRIATNGHRVALIPHPVAIVYPRQTMRDAFHHQLRWNLSIRFSRPAGDSGGNLRSVDRLGGRGAGRVHYFAPHVGLEDRCGRNERRQSAEQDGTASAARRFCFRGLGDEFFPSAGAVAGEGISGSRQAVGGGGEPATVNPGLGVYSRFGQLP